MFERFKFDAILLSGGRAGNLRRLLSENPHVSQKNMYVPRVSQHVLSLLWDLESQRMSPSDLGVSGKYTKWL